MPVAEGVMPAPPMACKARMAIRVYMFVERPQSSEAIVKVAMEERKMRLCPNCVLSLALNGSITTKPKEYTVSVHPAQLTEVCKSTCKACSAVATMVESTVIISSDSATIGNTINGFTAWYLCLNSPCVVLFCSIV